MNKWIYRTTTILSLALLLGFSLQGTNPLQGAIQGISGSKNTVSTTSFPSNVTSNNVQGYNVITLVNGKKVSEVHNVLMQGENATRADLALGKSYKYNYISLGNGTKPQNNSATLNKEISNCGLGPKKANYSRGGDGRWNYTVKFHDTCNNETINTSALKAGPSSGVPSNVTYYAGAYEKRQITLYSGDTLTQIWENIVKGP